MQNKVLSLAEYKCDEVSREALQGVVLPPATKSYQPIGHFWLLTLVLKAIEQCGFQVGNEHHGLSHDGARYFGLLELRSSFRHQLFQVTLIATKFGRYPLPFLFQTGFFDGIVPEHSNRLGHPG